VAAEEYQEKNGEGGRRIFTKAEAAPEETGEEYARSNDQG